jgi:hypothetical protein
MKNANDTIWDRTSDLQFNTDCMLCFNLFQVSLLEAKNKLVLKFHRRVPHFQTVKPVSFINVFAVVF